jgi:lambda repressor-like predicted transcriptional regulator
MSDDFKFTKSAIDWRRNTVLEKLAKGYSQAQIAKELQLHPSTISLDVQYLKERASNELKTHLTEKLPFEHARVTSGINDLLQRTYAILDKTTDPKMQLQTISVLTGLYSTVMSLATDASVIEQSLKRLEVWRDRNEAIFSAEDVNEGKENEKEDFQEDEEPTPTEQDEQIEEE